MDPLSVFGVSSIAAGGFCLLKWGAKAIWKLFTKSKKKSFLSNLVTSSVSAGIDCYSDMLTEAGDAWSDRETQLEIEINNTYKKDKKYYEKEKELKEAKEMIKTITQERDYWKENYFKMKSHYEEVIAKLRAENAELKAELAECYKTMAKNDEEFEEWDRIHG
ncbi:unnamed protein product [Moneuplotes crassus]|uniref:Uncharacterized protein n=1 Tax=Euplotes crassus TaxID=5936 RepID=A0AAD2D6W1_EUPCR|nr:unnamed protein product [Moneuplotes crassus]